MMDDPNVDRGKPDGGRSPTHPEDQPSSQTWASVERKDQPCVGEEARESSFLISEQRKAPVEYGLGTVCVSRRTLRGSGSRRWGSSIVWVGQRKLISKQVSSLATFAGIQG